MTTLIDTHAHLTFRDYHGKLDQVLQRACDQGLGRIITVGTTVADSEAAVGLAREHEMIIASVGICPHEAKSADSDAVKKLAELCQGPNVAAIGETGLDFHYELSPREEQERLFLQHLDLAEQLDLPVIIHSRDAEDRTIQIIESLGRPIRAVFHCFTGSQEQANKILDMGLYISFTGVITFKNAQLLARLAGAVPVDRVLIETDCPYMSPEPVRKVRPNEPAMVVYVLEKLSSLTGRPVEQLGKQIWENAAELFGPIVGTYRSIK